VVSFQLWTLLLIRIFISAFLRAARCTAFFMAARTALTVGLENGSGTVGVLMSVARAKNVLFARALALPRVRCWRGCWAPADRCMALDVGLGGAGGVLLRRSATAPVARSGRRLLPRLPTSILPSDGAKTRAATVVAYPSPVRLLALHDSAGALLSKTPRTLLPLLLPSGRRLRGGRRESSLLP